MSISTINYAFSALDYLNLWQRRDRDWCYRLRHCDDIDKLRVLLHEIATEYMVVRSFGVKQERDEDRRFLEVAEVFQEWKYVRETNFTRKVPTLADKLGQIYGQNVLSAATKFAWFRYKDRVGIRIYDRRAENTLKTWGHSLPKKKDNKDFYRFYVKAWNASYQDHRKKIMRAVALLPAAGRFSFEGIPARSKIQELMDYEWFAQRVFDRLLWDTGSTA